MKSVAGKLFFLLMMVSILSGCSLVRRWQGVTLADGGESKYRIVIAQGAPEPVAYGAQELQRFLKEISGAELPIVTDQEPATRREILVGESNRFADLGLKVDPEATGLEGYLLKTVQGRLVIVGATPRGTLYGCYGLLEDHLGCHWFTPEVSLIPKTKRLTLPTLNEVRKPRLENREPFVVDCFDGDWCARNRMNSHSANLEARHGGKVTYWAFAHSFNLLVPPDQYFDTHPEYFSLVKGKRLRDKSQLCCSNEDVIRIITDKVREAIKANPDTMIFSITQNDWYNYCECEKCQEIAKREGAQIGPVLALVNRVAEAIEKEYPDKLIDTFAYQWTRKPPKEMRPRPNVIVRLCSIECCFAHPLATCDSKENREFRDDLVAWSKVSNRLWVWDYTTDFRCYYLPFPNRRVLNDNIQFYLDHNVRGIFEQDTYNTPNGEFSKLGGYMMAKFLWDATYDENRAMNDFLQAYYGPAWEPLRAWIDLLEEKVKLDNQHVHIFDGPIVPYLTDEILQQGDALWEKAEAAVREQPEFLKRVRIERLSLDFARLERLKNRINERRQAGETPKPEEIEDLAVRIERFNSAAEEAGVTHLHEQGQPPVEYYQQIQRLLKEVAPTPESTLKEAGLIQ
jgi:hypothetical protein